MCTLELALPFTGAPICCLLWAGSLDSGCGFSCFIIFVVLVLCWWAEKKMIEVSGALFLFRNHSVKWMVKSEK